MTDTIAVPEHVSDTPPGFHGADHLCLERYRLMAPCGHGAMGHVYRARDTLVGRDVAIKIIPIEGSWDRVGREIRALKTIDHPNVVQILDAGHEGDLAILVMEFLHGRSLRSVLRTSRPSWEDAVQVALKVLHGLCAVHRIGLVHRDIKPSNIMIVEPGGALKIIDFGVVMPLEPMERITALGTMIGTPTYMSPEQFLGMAVDTSADVYSTGVILWQMLTALDPLKLSLTQVAGKIRFWERVVDAGKTGVPDAVWRVLTDMLQPVPDRRVQTAEECIRRLQAADGDGQAVPRPRTVRHTTTRLVSG